MKKYSPDKKHLVMTREQVRAFDSRAINQLGIPGAVLMENAGRSCAELIKEKLADIPKPKVCIFCGTGNNGGDGYVIARHLLNDSFKVTVVIIGDREKIKDDALTNLNILEKMDQFMPQVPIQQLDPHSPHANDKIETFAKDSHFLVDAIFGTGLTGQLKDEYLNIIQSINKLNCPVLAVDIPSGLDCDTAVPLGDAIKADYTVTFVAVKKGFTLENANQYTGQIFIASIGVEPKEENLI
ncbi:MAG: NAD(P)H-hydrate epimerase [Planctomycetes bacterium]|nr:NAD(P)H-hydrate epimerase [Planctomycetota bacterium]